MRTRPTSGKLPRTTFYGKSFLYDTPRTSQAETFNFPNPTSIVNSRDTLLNNLLFGFNKQLIKTTLPDLKNQGLNKLEFSNGHFFTLEKYLGDGESSIVYLAKCNAQFFAVKQFKKYPASINEIMIMQKFKEKNAPNVIGYHLSFAAQKYYFIVMDFAENGSLSDLIRKTADPLSWQIRYEVMIRGIIRGVAFIHAMNIIHRDIKSCNIFISNDLQPKLGDFGLAIKAGTQLNKFKGSPLWTAPEVLSTEAPNSFASDVYSSSTVMLQIAAWKHTPNKVRENMKANELQQLIVIEKKREPIPADCPPKLAKLITWGWQHNAQDRPTAANLEHELNSPMNEISAELSRLNYS